MAVAASLSVAASAHAVAEITVTSGLDDGTGCTLREAIVSANNNANQTGCAASGTYDDDVIRFNIPGGPPDTVNLTGTAPAVSSNMTIAGPGASGLTINGAGMTGQPTLNQSSGMVTISDLSITGGSGFLVGVADRRGGGIFKSGGTLTLNSVRVHDNDVSVSTNVAAENAIAVGGGVYNDDGAGNLTINDSVIEDNSVTATHGGTGALGADALGGGIASGDPIVVNRSTIDQNTATANRNDGDNNAGFGDARGGGIAVFNGVLTADRSTFSNNTASAAADDPNATLSAHAAGISVGASPGSSIELSTVAANRTNPTCLGCIIFNAEGAGVETFSTTTLAIRSSTIAGNGPTSGTLTPVGKNLSLGGGTSTVSFQNTIFADPFGGGANCDGAVAANMSSLGHNLEYSPTPGGTCDVTPVGTDTFADPDLQPLGANGGPTATMALLQTSPAVDKGTAAGQVTDPAVDQRGAGFVRPSDFLAVPNVADASDIGAFEVQSSDQPPVTQPPAAGSTGKRAAALKKCKKKKSKKAKKKCRKKAVKLPV